VKDARLDVFDELCLVWLYNGKLGFSGRRLLLTLKEKTVHVELDWKQLLMRTVDFDDILLKCLMC